MADLLNKRLFPKRLTPVCKGRAIFSGRRTDPAEKWAAKDLCPSKAANVSHFVERRDGRFKAPAGRFHPQSFDMPSGGFADLLPEYAGTIARTHGSSAGKSADRQFASKVVCDPGEKISKRSTAACLSHQSCTKLGLTSRTPQNDDHHLRDLQRQCSAQVVFN
jgi:hypothetical protein